MTMLHLTLFLPVSNYPFKILIYGYIPSNVKTKAVIREEFSVFKKTRYYFN